MKLHGVLEVFDDSAKLSRLLSEDLKILVGRISGNSIIQEVLSSQLHVLYGLGRHHGVNSVHLKL